MEFPLWKYSVRAQLLVNKRSHWMSYMFQTELMLLPPLVTLCPPNLMHIRCYPSRCILTLLMPHIWSSMTRPSSLLPFCWPSSVLAIFKFWNIYWIYSHFFSTAAQRPQPTTVLLQKESSLAPSVSFSQGSYKSYLCKTINLMIICIYLKTVCQLLIGLMIKLNSSLVPHFGMRATLTFLTISYTLPLSCPS